MKLRIGTRGSTLAMVQTEYIAGLLNDLDIETEIIIVKTTGDKDQNKKLADLGIGVFTKELDNKMLENEIDIAVHSLKDVPTLWSEELQITATPKRESPDDIIIWRKDCDFDIEHDELNVGTSSIRRTSFLQFTNPNLTPKLLRGNVATRINKLRNGEYDTIVMAKAGLVRQGIDLSEFNYKKLDILPAPAQGVIGVASRKADTKINQILEKICDKKTYIEATAERWALKEYGGGCQAPFGAFAVYDTEEGILNLRCELVDEQGTIKRVKSNEGFVICTTDDVELSKELGARVGALFKEIETFTY
ncbi:hydroxymethylbilane synthase [Methanococcus maripaludis]|uniref:hydroxymethylbilane synthase n=1 Tax=Methanococcus maripaludis TaxID=39152 RepID=UPI0031438930